MEMKYKASPPQRLIKSQDTILSCMSLNFWGQIVQLTCTFISRLTRYVANWHDSKTDLPRFYNGILFWCVYLHAFKWTKSVLLDDVTLHCSKWRATSFVVHYCEAKKDPFATGTPVETTQWSHWNRKQACCGAIVGSVNIKSSTAACSLLTHGGSHLTFPPPHNSSVKQV